MTKPLVVFGLLGTRLDAAKARQRWESWRPTVSLARFDDLLVARFELLYTRRYETLARQVAEDIESMSPDATVNLHRVAMQDPWDFAEVYGTLFDFARAYDFKEDEEDYLVHMTTGTHVAQICLFLLTESRHLPARLIQTSPPPARRAARPGEYRIIDLDLSRYDRLAQRFAEEKTEDLDFLKAGIATRSAGFNRLIERIEEVALGSRAPILLAGPTGVGKTRLARRIFELKKRHHQVSDPFVEVNCATLRGDQAMSMLFGHKKGAFTGALADRAGLLRAADGGLLFLDEVGDLGLDEQTMLLRAVEERVFVPMGSDEPVGSDFQLVTGTNRDLAACVRDGQFRDDLLARLNVWTFELPPLRERLEDLVPNLDFELEHFEQTEGRRVTFNREARERFLGFAAGPEAVWSANFRDLNAAITRLATLARGGRIGLELVDEEIRRLRRHWQRLEEAEVPGLDRVARVLGEDAAAALDLFDRVQLEKVLEVCQQSPTLSAAGRTLFARSRERKKSTNDADRLKKYLQRFGLSWTDVSAA